MGVASIERRVSAARALNARGRNGDKLTRVRRPYTAFERGGIRRFSPGTEPRLFRVT
jgi:hypothetical protein